MDITHKFFKLIIMHTKTSKFLSHPDASRHP